MPDTLGDIFERIGKKILEASQQSRSNPKKTKICMCAFPLPGCKKRLMEEQI